VLGLVIALLFIGVWDYSQTRVYLIWRGWGLFALAVLVDVLCPPAVTIVVALLLS